MKVSIAFYHGVSENTIPKTGHQSDDVNLPFLVLVDSSKLSKTVSILLMPMTARDQTGSSELR